VYFTLYISVYLKSNTYTFLVSYIHTFLIKIVKFYCAIVGDQVYSWLLLIICTVSVLVQYTSYVSEHEGAVAGVRVQLL
jgi:hypothetical protein